MDGVRKGEEEELYLAGASRHVDCMHFPRAYLRWLFLFSDFVSGAGKKGSSWDDQKQAPFFASACMLDGLRRRIEMRMQMKC
jgi:hypothetical protein